MSSLTTSRRRGRARDRACERVGHPERAEDLGRVTEAMPSLFSDVDTVGGEPTLEAFVSGVWEGLAARQIVACPWCDGPMAAVPDGAQTPSDGPSHVGYCTDCGATLQ